MNINELISIIKKKLEHEISIEDMKIEDKSFLKIIIKSKELKKMNKINSNKRIFQILEKEIKSYIHSLQLFIT